VPEVQDSQTARQPDRPGMAATASRSSAACTRLNCRTEATLDDTGRVRWARDVRGKKIVLV
jgi:hypothetical protein